MAPGSRPIHSLSFLWSEKTVISMETEPSEISAAEKMGAGCAGEDFETGAAGSTLGGTNCLTGAVALVPTGAASVSLDLAAMAKKANQEGSGRVIDTVQLADGSILKVYEREVAPAPVVFGHWESHLPGRLGCSRKVIEGLRKQCVEGVDWARPKKRILWSDAGVERLKGLLGATSSKLEVQSSKSGEGNEGVQGGVAVGAGLTQEAGLEAGAGLEVGTGEIAAPAGNGGGGEGFKGWPLLEVVELVVVERARWNKRIIRGQRDGQVVRVQVKDSALYSTGMRIQARRELEEQPDLLTVVGKPPRWRGKY